MLLRLVLLLEMRLLLKLLIWMLEGRELRVRLMRLLRLLLVVMRGGRWHALEWSSQPEGRPRRGLEVRLGEWEVKVLCLGRARENKAGRGRWFWVRRGRHAGTGRGRLRQGRADGTLSSWGRGLGASADLGRRRSSRVDEAIVQTEPRLLLVVRLLRPGFACCGLLLLRPSCCR